MIIQGGELRGGAERLLAIPVAHVVHVGAGEQDEARADGTRPMRDRAEFVDGDEGKLRRGFAAAIGAGWIRCIGRVDDARECLAVVFR